MKEVGEGARERGGRPGEEVTGRLAAGPGQARVRGSWPEGPRDREEQSPSAGGEGGAMGEKECCPGEERGRPGMEQGRGRPRATARWRSSYSGEDWEGGAEPAEEKGRWQMVEEQAGAGPEVEACVLDGEGASTGREEEEGCG